MNMNSHPSDSTHKEVFLLLPWYVNGTLTSDDRHRVEEHIPRCRSCQEELALLRNVEQATRVELPARDVATRGFDRLMDRVDQSERRRSGLQLVLNRVWHRIGEFLVPLPKWSAAIPVLLVLVTAYWVAPQMTDGDGGYETLSSNEMRAEPPTVIEIRTHANVDVKNLLRELEPVVSDATLETAADGQYLLQLPADVSAEEILDVLEVLRSNRAVHSARLFKEQIS